MPTLGSQRNDCLADLDLATTHKLEYFHFHMLPYTVTKPYLLNSNGEGKKGSNGHLFHPLGSLCPGKISAQLVWYELGSFFSQYDSYLRS